MIYPHVMIDLETLDTDVAATIVSIGAVRFGPAGVSDFGGFYSPVAWDQRDRRTVSRECLVEFWLKQPAEVQAALGDPAAVPLAGALLQLSRWIGEDKLVWAGPATFDLAILKHAYANNAMTPPPWKYNATRCYTTLRNLFPDVPRVVPAVAHNALEDARAQAQHAVDILWPAECTVPPSG